MNKKISSTSLTSISYMNNIHSIKIFKGYEILMYFGIGIGDVPYLIQSKDILCIICTTNQRQ
jgi:hypothetical protein